MAEISLGWRHGEVKGSFGYKITVKKENYVGCEQFIHSTYTIEKSGYGRDVKLIEILYYKGHEKQSLFTYDSDTFIIKKVQLYSSICHPNVPLVLVVNLSNTAEKYYIINEQKSFVYDKGDRSGLDNLKDDLVKENDKKFKKIQLKGSGDNYNFDAREEHFSFEGHSSKFKKTTYIAKVEGNTEEKSVSEYSLSLSSLFTSIKNNDTTALESFIGKSYDGIIVYFINDPELTNLNTIPLFISFVSNCSIQNYYIKKSSNLNKTSWELERHSHETDEQLFNKLILLQQQLSTTMAILIDKGSDYDKKAIKNITGCPNLSNYQPENITVSTRQKVPGSTNYSFLQQTITTNLKFLFELLLKDGKKLTESGELKDLVSKAQLEKKMESLKGTYGETLLKSVESLINLELEFFISNKSIQLNVNEVTTSYLQYVENSKDPVKVYFYDHENNYKNGTDIFPLIFEYKKKYYAPETKNDYFTKWKQRSDITSSGPTLTNKLNEINKLFNDINISVTSDGSYGLTTDIDLKNFNPNRINVKQSINSPYYRKVSHSSIQKYRIGDIYFNNNKIGGINDSDVTDEINRVNVYYHTNDYLFRKPLLISLGSQSKSKDSKWYSLSELRGKTWIKEKDDSKYDDDIKLGNELDSIKKRFYNPLIVRINEQNEYSVDIKPRDSSSFSSQTARISLQKNPTCASSTGPYTCFLQDLSQYYKQVESIMVSSSQSEDPFSDIDFELMFTIFSMPLKIKIGTVTHTYIEYKNTDDKLYVYFSKESSSSKVPLLVSYNSKWYRPESKANYFREWSLATSPDTFDINNHEEIKSHLDNVNGILNEIDISNTKIGSYGLYKHNEIPSDDLKSFSARVIVQRYKGKCFRRVVHSTVDKARIGDLYFNGTKVLGIDINRIQSTCNQVCVYYLPCDKDYSNPFLIKIFSDTISDNCKWYYRKSQDGREWENIDTAQFSSHGTIKAEIDKIKITNKFKIGINLEVTNIEYNILAKNCYFTDVKPYESTMSVNTIGSIDEVKVNDYRFHAHGLKSFYEKNRTKIMSRFGFSGSEPSFELEIKIQNNKLTLVDSNLRVTTFYYTYEDCIRAYNMDVYFYNPDHNKTDIVPLLFKFKDRCFAPKDKDTYFTKWEELNVKVPSSDPNSKIILKRELDRILHVLNEIDFSKKCEYGIPFCDPKTGTKREYYQNNNFHTKRVYLTKYKNKNHILHVHSSVNRYKIGLIREFGKHKFEKHTKELKDDNIHEIGVIYQVGNLYKVKWILLNEKSNLSTTTRGLYYSMESGPTPTNYLFKTIQGGCNIVSILKGEPEFYCNGEDESTLSEIKDILIEVKKDKMTEQPKGSDEVSNCEKQDESESEIQECSEEVTLPSTIGHQGLRSSSAILHQNNSLLVPPQSQLSISSLVPPTEALPSKPGSTTSLGSEPSGGSNYQEHSEKNLDTQARGQSGSPPHQPQPAFSHPAESPGPPEQSHLSAKQTEPGSSSPKPQDVSNSSDLSTSTLSGGQSSSKDSYSEDSSVHISGNELHHQSGGDGEKARGTVSEGHESTEVEISGQPSISPDPSHIPDALSGGRTDNGVSSHTGPEAATPLKTPGTGSANEVHKYVNTPSEEFNDIMNKAIDYTVKNPGVVGGAGGGVATVAGSSYPLYKYVFRCKK